MSCPASWQYFLSCILAIFPVLHPGHSLSLCPVLTTQTHQVRGSLARSTTLRKLSSGKTPQVRSHVTQPHPTPPHLPRATTGEPPSTRATPLPGAGCPRHNGGHPPSRVFLAGSVSTLLSLLHFRNVSHSGSARQGVGQLSQVAVRLLLPGGLKQP